MIKVNTFQIATDTHVVEIHVRTNSLKSAVPIKGWVLTRGETTQKHNDILNGIMRSLLSDYDAREIKLQGK